MAYSDKVIDHYENPRNVGTLDKDDPNVGTGLVGAPACGDVMKLQLKVNDDGVIEDAKFKTFGCGSAIASSSLATEWVKGKTVDEAMTIKNTQIVEELNLPPVKIHCSVLAEDAIKARHRRLQARSAKRAQAAASAPQRQSQRADERRHERTRRRAPSASRRRREGASAITDARRRQRDREAAARRARHARRGAARRHARRRLLGLLLRHRVGRRRAARERDKVFEFEDGGARLRRPEELPLPRRLRRSTTRRR